VSCGDEEGVMTEQAVLLGLTVALLNTFSGIDYLVGRKKMDAWIGIVGTLVGVALGGVISYLTSRQQINHEKRLALSKRQIEKIEKAHELLTNIGVRYRGFFGSDTSFLYTGKQGDYMAEGRLPFEELDMLFSFYASSLAPNAKKLIVLCQSYGASSAEARIFAPGTSQDKTTLLNALKEKYLQIEAQITELKSQLAQTIQAYAT
jgi:hypothetical protein